MHIIGSVIWAYYFFDMKTVEQIKLEKQEYYYKNREKINKKWKCKICDSEILLRSNKSGKCIKCVQIKENKLSDKEKREANIEYYKEKDKRSYIKNREKRLEYAREYRKTHAPDSEKLNKATRKFNKTEKWKINMAKCNARRRLKIKWIVDKWNFTKTEWDNLCKKHNNLCVCCWKKEKLTVDHILPISKWWLNNIDNIQPLCKSCNCKKRDKHICYI